MRNDLPKNDVVARCDPELQVLREAAIAYYEKRDPGTRHAEANAALEAAWEYGRVLELAHKEFACALATVVSSLNPEPVTIIHQPDELCGGWPAVEHADAWIEPKECRR